MTQAELNPKTPSDAASGETQTDLRLQQAVNVAGRLGLGASATLNSDPAVSVWLVRQLLENIPTSQAPLSDLVNAARTFLVAVSMGQLGRVAPTDFQKLEAALDLASTRLLEAVPHDIVSDEFAFGLASFHYLARLFRAPLPHLNTPDFSATFCRHLDLVALLADVVDASIRRRRVLSEMQENARLTQIWCAEGRPGLNPASPNSPLQ